MDKKDTGIDYKKFHRPIMQMIRRSSGEALTQAQIHACVERKFRKQFTPFDLVVSVRGHGVVWQNKVRTAVLELRKAGLIRILTGSMWRTTKDKFWALTAEGEKILDKGLRIDRSRKSPFGDGDMVRVKRLLSNRDDSFHVFLGRSGVVIGRRGSMLDVKITSLDKATLFHPEELVPA